MRKRIVLYGAGGHGKVVADILEKMEGFDLAGFVDDTRKGEFFGLKVLGRGSDMAALRRDGIDSVIVTVGNCFHRKNIHEKLAGSGFSFAMAVHPSAQVARGAVVGDGTVVMAGAVIGPDARIGVGCIINTGATVDHDCMVAGFVHIAPGAHISGGARIGEGSLLGTGSSVRPGVSVGEWSIIGVGAAVVSDIPDRVVAVGVPAKPVGPCTDWSPA
jgi:UDP-perosamine 4-acetyltransferase